MPDELGSHMSLNDMTLPHVPNPEHEAWHAISVANDRVSREQQRLRPLLRPGEFGEDHSHHEGLDHDAEYAL